MQETDLVRIDNTAVAQISRFIHSSMRSLRYTPRSWRDHALHLVPPEPFDWADPRVCDTLNWIFLVSALNFSFWSEKEGTDSRYGIEWRMGWGKEERTVWTGYWSLPAALDRALEEGIPITDPAFYASETRCPDTTIERVFRRASRSAEDIPLLRERIAVMREVGATLVSHYNGSFMHFIRAFHLAHPSGTALDFVRLITHTFPSFADECTFDGMRLCFWKRAQILVAETWAAFYPTSGPHPIFPNDGARALSMFADYRVPQILHHLGLLVYKPALAALLAARSPLAYGSREEVAIRAGSIIAVEHVVAEIRRIRAEDESDSEGEGEEQEVCSVLVDFYLWDLAKLVEAGKGVISCLPTQPMLPAHRTRSIWY
ncbi:hypothetical protein K488DRAFT_78799 [Vararia minispora EC-137]|uniref:Uncharacterized protein n=1 Tax=Vararia minispora EC-137 TaxID=1314806 RepID=A0ACB8QJT7_9AGAM|nr:hypothetical protein K488DRAFT_78799 [Vararia minispora EC-137]